MDPDGEGLTIRGDWSAEGSPSIVGRYRLTDFGTLAATCLRSGELLVVGDVRSELPAADAASFQAVGVAAVACMLLVKDGRLTAMMAIHDRVARAWSGDDLAVLREVTERCWAHIERVRADAALREAAGQLAALNATLEQRVEERTARLGEAEAALRQSQKLEAVGQLTGGVAHDFNNLLTIIRSSVDFLRRPDLPDDRRRRYMDAVSDTVERATKLTGQLLAFARRQALKPEVFEAGARLKSVADMLDTVTGSRIRVLTELPERPCHVLADVSQFETAVINMAVNARDAMDGEGTLTLRLSCSQGMPSIRGHGGSPAPFAAVSLSDTGTGIAPELLGRIFEPFYTTKEVGKGTGLGLSQVFGFAKQSGGDVNVESAPGRGTTFTLYLPEIEAAPEPGGACWSWRTTSRSGDSPRRSSRTWASRRTGRRTPRRPSTGSARMAPASTSCSRTWSCPAWAASPWPSCCAGGSPACRSSWRPATAMRWPREVVTASSCCTSPTPPTNSGAP
jgi:signal transduction histidine kinase